MVILHNLDNQRVLALGNFLKGEWFVAKIVNCRLRLGRGTIKPDVHMPQAHSLLRNALIVCQNDTSYREINRHPVAENRGVTFRRGQ